MNLLRIPAVLFLFVAFFTAPSSADKSDGSHQQIARSAAPMPIFTDVTVPMGLKTMGFTFGNPIWGDFNNDGYLDLFADNHYIHKAYLYRNDAGATFTDIEEVSGMRSGGDRHGSAWVDFNHDGYLDLSITKGARLGGTLGMKQDELYRNLGDSTFVEVALEAGADNTYGRGRSVAWGDFDRDGYPDILLGNLKTPMVLYKNNRDGTFTNVADAAGLSDLQYTDCAFVDYDNDGFPDVFCTISISHSTVPDALFHNNGDGTFTNFSAQAGLLPFSNGRSIAWADYDNDGDLDLFVARGLDEGGVKQTLYRNNGTGTFTDVSDVSGLGVVANNRAACWGDFDNDGYLDLYVVNSGDNVSGKGPNFLYRNNRNGSFTDVASRAGVTVPVLTRGRGAAWGDYDNDGFLDLFVTNGEDNTDYIEGPQFLFHNRTGRQHWLKVRLVGTLSDSQGLGAKVTLRVGSRIQYRELNGADGHFLSQGAAPLHFGLGKAALVDQLIVTWPSGIIQVLEAVAPDQTLTVTETP